MRATEASSDDAVLAELGERLTAARLSLDLTQARLAGEAGVSKRTVERLEAGQSTQMTSFVRILRALGLLDRLDALLPPPRPSPLALLRREGRRPRRASGTRTDAVREGGEPWRWGDEEP